MVFKKGNDLLLCVRRIIVIIKGAERQKHGEHLRPYYDYPSVK